MNFSNLDCSINGFRYIFGLTGSFLPLVGEALPSSTGAAGFLPIGGSRVNSKARVPLISGSMSHSAYWFLSGIGQFFPSNLIP